MEVSQLGKKTQYTAPLNVLNDMAQDRVCMIRTQEAFLCSLTMIYVLILCFQDYDPFAEHRPKKVRDRDNDYQKQKRPNMMISPARYDPFADGRYKQLLTAVF